MLTNKGFFARSVSGLFEEGEIICTAVVSDCHCQVAEITTPFGALERTLLEVLIKLDGCQSQVLGGSAKRRIRLEGGISRGGESVPGANHLTNVASENPISHMQAQLFGNVTLVFDGEVGDAAAGIKRTVWEDGLGGAGGDAACACATVIGDDGVVGFEFQPKQNFSQQKSGAYLWVD